MSVDVSKLPERVAEHLNLAYKVAFDVRRRYGVQIDSAELRSSALEGLLKAHDSFDGAFQTEFSTYAFYRIRGEVIDNLRRLGLLRRSYKRRAGLEVASNDILLDSARSRPSEVTVATSSGWIGNTLDELAAAFCLDPEEQAANSEMAGRLRTAFERLSKELRSLLKRLYWDGQSMAEIARQKGVSKSWVSRTHKKALEQLRTQLFKDP